MTGNTSPGSNIIHAEPTKDFFITMLVRDIPLMNAVADLVDNCVDGARRLRPDGDYSGLQVDIEVTKDYLRINDNCGGIPVQIARDHAFRFGRPSEAEPTEHSIGQFGVGMKRAFFRLGRYFSVRSTAANSRFSMSVDVDAWRGHDEWKFSFSTVEEELPEIPAEERGTVVEVRSLHPSVSSQFSLSPFLTSLNAELEAAHHQSMERHLKISLNKHGLNFRPATLLQSEEIQPAFEMITFSKSGHEPVFVRIYAGVAPSDPTEAGWYVICNGRLVLAADKTRTTGWGTNIPKYHNQFAEFQGYVYFDSDEAGLLPWTTTKAGVDSDSDVFQAVRIRMVRLMRPIIDFLNRMDAEINSDASSKPLTAAFQAAQPMSVASITVEAPFRAPAATATTAPKTRNIQYNKPVKEVERVQESLGVTTLREVGEKTFEYYLEMECPD